MSVIRFGYFEPEKTEYAEEELMLLIRSVPLLIENADKILGTPEYFFCEIEKPF
jgi:hypothetical protein